MLEQLPHADGADVFDHVQGDERFPGLHSGWNSEIRRQRQLK